MPQERGNQRANEYGKQQCSVIAELQAQTFRANWIDTRQYIQQKKQRDYEDERIRSSLYNPIAVKQNTHYNEIDNTRWGYVPFHNNLPS